MSENNISLRSAVLMPLWTNLHPLSVVGPPALGRQSRFLPLLSCKVLASAAIVVTLSFHPRVVSDLPWGQSWASTQPLSRSLWGELGQLQYPGLIPLDPRGLWLSQCPGRGRGRSLRSVGVSIWGEVRDRMDPEDKLLAFPPALECIGPPTSPEPSCMTSCGFWKLWAAW